MAKSKSIFFLIMSNIMTKVRQGSESDEESVYVKPNEHGNKKFVNANIINNMKSEIIQKTLKGISFPKKKKIGIKIIPMKNKKKTKTTNKSTITKHKKNKNKNQTSTKKLPIINSKITKKNIQ